MAFRGFKVLVITVLGDPIGLRIACVITDRAGFTLNSEKEARLFIIQRSNQPLYSRIKLLLYKCAP